MFSEPELAAFLEALRSSSLEDIHNTNLGNWAARQGLNYIGTLSNGNKVLMKKRNTLGDNRYRMQSELFSHYFNCYLDLWNTPPTALGCAREKSGKTMLAEAPEDADDNDTTTCFIISKYTEGLQDTVYVPDHAISLDAVSRSPRELNRLLEWSDFFLFDFLTAHSDRLLDNSIQLVPHVDLIVPRKKVPNLARPPRETSYSLITRTRSTSVTPGRRQAP